MNTDTGTGWVSFLFWTGDDACPPEIEELLFVPWEEMSVREKQRIEMRMNYGELYAGRYSRLDDGSIVLTTDLGSPDSNVELRVPVGVDLKTAVRALVNATKEML